MTNLRKLVSSVLIGAMATIFTGCGDDDDGNGDGLAPAALNGRTYSLTDAGPGGTVTFHSGTDSYSLTQGGTTESGSFQATRSGDVWTVFTTDSTGTTTSTLTLTFTGSESGTYTYDRPDAEPSFVSGSFAGSGSAGTSTSTGTDTGTSTSTGTDTGTSTSTGTDTGTSTSTGTTTGTTTGTVPAPATLSSINVRTSENVVYTITFTGGTSGTFSAVNPQSTPMGSGTFVYTPSGNNANLRLTYSSEGEEYDDMNLSFTQQAGSGQPNPFTGTQKIGATVSSFSGTFTY